jgi:HNH endonuclease
MANQRIPPAEYLREALSYDPITGALTWRERPLHHFKHAHAQAAWNGYFPGRRAGSADKKYSNVYIDDVRHGTHRIIWTMQTGSWPKQIDHKNRDGHDNRWENLREATHQQNKWNRSRPQTGLPRGVRRKGPRFTAQAKVNYQNIHLGSFDTPEEAHEAWRAFVRKKRGEFFKSD